jgi:hypothetical protein
MSSMALTSAAVTCGLRARPEAAPAYQDKLDYSVASILVRMGHEKDKGRATTQGLVAQTTDTNKTG